MIGNNLLMAGDEGYNLTRSLRFRASASAYLSRTPASNGNKKTLTWSAWVKRGKLGAGQTLFAGGTYGVTYGSFTLFSFDANDCLNVIAGVYGLSTDFNLTTSAVRRDPSGWYHIVLRIDTTQATAADRIRVYVNNELQTFASGSQPTQNYDTIYNYAGQPQTIGSAYNLSYLDGYIAESYLSDGQSLAPSSFGSYNSTTGVWQPAAYTGTYGTNGFYLPFTDNSALTTASNVGLGKDFSGNSNYWTTNNISLTAGVTYDSMTDVPTLTSATAANFAVLNPLSNPSGTLAQGNLYYTNTGITLGSIYATTGKFYFECIYSGNPDVTGVNLGIYSGQVGTPVPSFAARTGQWRIYAGNTTTAYFTNETTSDVNYGVGPTPSSGSLLQLCIDIDAGKIWYGKNNVWYNSTGGTTGDPSTGANPTFTISSPSTRGGFTFGIGSPYAGGSFTANFGQRPFSYTPPTGFVALNNFNIPAGSITTSGSFTGNVSADGPSIYLNGVPTAMTINGNAVTLGTHADKTAYGFKVRSSSTSYNSTGTNTYSITTTGAKFKFANAQGNP